MVIKSLSEMLNKKDKDCASFLGSGYSINNISLEEWKNIKLKTDMWTMNNWIYHDVVPNFYHIEVKKYNVNFFRDKLMEKKNSYKNVSFFFPDRDIDKFKNKYNILVENLEYYTYTADRKKAKCNDIDFSDGFNSLSMKNGCSFSLLLEALYKFGYKKVFLYGVDLINSKYFWYREDGIYKDTHNGVNNNVKSIYDKHPAYGMIQYIKDFNDTKMIPEGRSFYIGHRKSPLSNFLKYNDICEE